MKNFQKTNSLIVFIQSLFMAILFVQPVCHGFFSGNNLSFAYDQNWIWQNRCSKIWNSEETQNLFTVVTGAGWERGFDGFGVNKDHKHVNFAHIFSPTESYLHSMDNSVDPNVKTAELQKLVYPPLMLTNTTGNTLSYKLEIDKIQTVVNLWWGIEAPNSPLGQFSATIYLPLKHTDYLNFNATMLPLPEDLQAALDALPEIKNELNDLATLTQKNLAGLNLSRNPSSNIIGDLLLMAKLNKSFGLANAAKHSFANIAFQIGLSLPTAAAKDPQLAFGYARGNDNAVGLVLGAALNLYVAKQVRAGIAGDAVFSLAETSSRRLRKTAEQDDILISDQVMARREPGNLYRATALLELSSQDQIYAAHAGWQFLYQEKDLFKRLNELGYDNDLVNASQRWQRKYFHQGFLGASIDFKKLTESKIAPKLSLNYKFPITGERAELYHCLSLLACLNF